MSPDAPPIQLAEQIDCARREVALRRRVYPRWIDAGRMTQAKADREIRAMEAVVVTLVALNERERLI